MSAGRLALIWLALIAANLLYAWLASAPPREAISTALERSWFQAIPLLCVWLAQRASA
jgi:hypothetical protein